MYIYKQYIYIHIYIYTYILYIYIYIYIYQLTLINTIDKLKLKIEMNTVLNTERM